MAVSHIKRAVSCAKRAVIFTQRAVRYIRGAVRYIEMAVGYIQRAVNHAQRAATTRKKWQGFNHTGQRRAPAIQVMTRETIQGLPTCDRETRPA